MSGTHFRKAVWTSRLTTSQSFAAAMANSSRWLSSLQIGAKVIAQSTPCLCFQPRAACYALKHPADFTVLIIQTLKKSNYCIYVFVFLGTLFETGVSTATSLTLLMISSSSLITFNHFLKYLELIGSVSVVDTLIFTGGATGRTSLYH